MLWGVLKGILQKLGVDIEFVFEPVFWKAVFDKTQVLDRRKVLPKPGFWDGGCCQNPGFGRRGLSKLVFLQRLFVTTQFCF